MLLEANNASLGGNLGVTGDATLSTLTATGLVNAANEGQTDVVEMLVVEKGACKDVIDARNIYGRSALALAWERRIHI